MAKQKPARGRPVNSASAAVAMASSGETDVVAFAAADSLSVVVRLPDEASHDQRSEQ